MLDYIWNSIIEYGIATDEELQLVTCRGGFSMKYIKKFLGITNKNLITKFESELSFAQINA